MSACTATGQEGKSRENKNQAHGSRRELKKASLLHQMIAYIFFKFFFFFFFVYMRGKEVEEGRAGGVRIDGGVAGARSVSRSAVGLKKRTKT